MIGLGALSAEAGDVRMEKPIREQVIEIVSSQKATVRKWMRAPRVLVIHDREPPRDFIEGMVARISGQAPNFPGIRSVEYLDLAEFQEPLPGRARFRVKRRDVDGRVLVDSGFVFDEGRVGLADIYVFLTDIPTGLFFGALTQSGGPLHRRFAEGAPHSCYYNVSSLDDVLRYGMVFINSGWDRERVEACLFEEFMHTLGILNDSEDSQVFTFNDRVVDPVDRSADFALLQALYTASIKPGDAPELVADAFQLSR
ncbi:MAG: DUF2927 domain-containing protein [Pseudomonadota bacterium]